MNSQMEEMYRVWSRERGGERPSSPSVPLSPDLHVFTSLETLKLVLLGFSWRLHFLGMTD